MLLFFFFFFFLKELVYCRFECEYNILDRLVRLEIGRENLEKKVTILEDMNNAKSELIDELKTQLDDVKTKKQAVAFKVRLSGDVKLTVGQKLQYDTVVVNVGNSFDEASGFFRAPVSGVYIFSVTTCSKGSDWGVLNIVKDRKVIGQVRSGDVDRYYDCNSEVTTSYVEVNSAVWVEMESGHSGIVNTIHWCSFTAVLVN